MRKELRTKDRLARQNEETKIFRVTLDTVDKPNLQMILYPAKIAAATKSTAAPEVAPDDNDLLGADGTKEAALDPVRDEALNILADLADLTAGPKTASATAPPTPQ